MSATFAMFAVLGFLAVVLALEGLYNLWANKRSPEAKRIADRLASLTGEVRTEISLERKEQKTRWPWLQALLEKTHFGEGLTRWVGAAGMDLSAGELVAWSVVLAITGFTLPLLLGKPAVFGLALGLVLAVLPWWRVSAARGKRITRMEDQFPEALDMMGRAMRAGHSFPTAIRMVGDEMAEPMGKDFRILSDEMSYGVGPQLALNNLAERIPIADVRYFVVAVMIQRESGGNLAELLDSISAIVRARLKLLGEVRTLSAEGKMSAWVLGLLPFAVGLLVNLVNPKFMDVLWTDPLGLQMVGVALFMMVLGVIWMRKIIRIHV